MSLKIPEFPQSVSSAISDHFESPFVLQGFFDLDELDFITHQKNSCEKVLKQSGVINYKYSKGGELERFLIEKFTPHLGSIYRHGGSFFETPEPFHVHTDSGKLEDMEGGFFPFKNILIPLVSSSSHSPLYTVFFNQRNLGQASHFWKGFEFHNKRPHYNFKVTDYGRLLNLRKSQFSREEHQEHLGHLPISCLQGLSIETTLQWTRGDAIVFDCSQLHASNNFRVFRNNLKSGLSLFTKKEYLL